MESLLHLGLELVEARECFTPVPIEQRHQPRAMGEIVDTPHKMSRDKVLRKCGGIGNGISA